MNPSTSSERSAKRSFNFNAGPGALPLAVLERMREELLDYRGTGMSVMEMSHRSPEFEAISDNAERALRRVLGIPDDYAVAFLQGGGSLQFAMVPMNLYQPGKAGGRAAYRFMDREGHRGTEENRAVPPGGFDGGRKVHARAAGERDLACAGCLLRGDVHQQHHRGNAVEPDSGRPAAFRWWRTCLRISLRNPWTCGNLG